MKKTFFQLVVLLLATFLLTSSKSVANDVPLISFGFDKEQENFWSPLSYVDGLLCQNREAKYPLITPIKPTNDCRYKSWSKNKYSLLREDIKENDTKSVN